MRRTWRFLPSREHDLEPGRSAKAAEHAHARGAGEDAVFERQALAQGAQRLWLGDAGDERVVGLGHLRARARSGARRGGGRS